MIGEDCVHRLRRSVSRLSPHDSLSIALAPSRGMIPAPHEIGPESPVNARGPFRPQGGFHKKVEKTVKFSLTRRYAFCIMVSVHARVAELADAHV